MLKTRKRWISLLVVLTFLLSLLPAGMASAATTYSALSVPTVGRSEDDMDLKTLGTLQIEIDTLAPGTHQAVFSLPDDFRVDEDDLARNFSTNLDPSVISIDRIGDVDDNEFGLTINTVGMAVYDDVKILLPFDAVYIPDKAPSGDIKLTVDGLRGQLSSGEVVIGRIAGGEVTVSVSEVPSITDAGTTGGEIVISIKENRGGALEVDDQSLKFTLPPGFSWRMDDADIEEITNTPADATLVLDENNDRVLYVDVSNGSGSTKALFRMYVDIAVDESRAKFGDVTVKIGGETSATPTSLVIAKYADYGVDIDVAETPEVLAGRLAQEIGDITIEELAPNSLVDGRTVTLTLPANAKWAEIGDVETDGGLSIVGDILPVGDDGRTIKFIVDQLEDNEAGSITLKDVTVDLAVDVTGDLKVDVGGSAGAKGEAVVAKIVAPISATASAKNEVKIGLRDQAAGDITITEAQAEALIQGKTLTLTLPDNCDWSAEPKVEVTAGDLEVANVDVDDEVLSFDIKSESSEASTIKISGIKYTIDRTVPEGDLTVKIGGTAVNEVNDLAELEGLTREYYTDFDETEAMFPDATTAVKVVNAVCVTPAPGETKGVAVFKIGETKYTVNGKEYTMDVAPIAEAGRTYLPARFVANAMGVPDSNIIWDQANQTVTVIRDARIVQMKVGSNQILVNGIPLTMDAAPKVVPGRVLIPFRFLAQALGAEVVWDPADPNTITLNF